MTDRPMSRRIRIPPEYAEALRGLERLSRMVRDEEESGVPYDRAEAEAIKAQVLESLTTRLATITIDEAKLKSELPPPKGASDDV